MTRLCASDLNDSANQWEQYESRLYQNIGGTLFNLASEALCVDSIVAEERLRGLSVAVVPVSSGLGVITGFAEMLAEISERLGCTAFITEPDQKGFHSARQKGASLMIWADDDVFVAENLKNGVKAENGRATGLGFAAALERLCGGVNGKHICVLGCGPVGCAAADALSRRSARLTVTDLNLEKSRALARQLVAQSGASVEVISPEQLAWEDVDGIIDAAPRSVDKYAALTKRSVCVAAPAVPNHWPDRHGFWHDPLQTGTAVMLLAAAMGIEL